MSGVFGAFFPSWVSVKLTSRTVSKTGPAPQNAFYSLNNDGTVTSQAGFLEQWCTPGSKSGNYWVRATLLSGTNPVAGAMGIWLHLSANQSWSNTDIASSDTMTSTVRFDIASDSGGVNIVVSATVTIQVITA